jgi:tripartite-type tricarboxylate transporter receptor subunit TctC
MLDKLRALIALLLIAPVFALAQDYPTRPVRLVVAFPPGGATDIIARLVAAKLTERLGQQFLVDNKPGGGTNIGTEFVAHSAPDGYTLLMCTFTCAANPSLYTRLNYDLLRDFVGVSLVASAPLVVVVHPSLLVHSTQELIALAKAKPGALKYASFGNGSSAHLATELFKNMAGVDILHVPYKGDAPAVTDLMGGHVDLMFSNIVTALQHIQAKKLRAFAVTSAKRLPRFPDLPTVAETLPGYQVDPWFGIVAPNGTPRPIIDKLNTEIVQTVKTPETEERIAATGAFVVGSPSQQLDSYMRSEVAKWEKVIKTIGVHLD